MSPNGEANKGKAITRLSVLLLEACSVYGRGIWMKHKTKAANPRQEKSTPQHWSIDRNVSKEHKPKKDLFGW